MTTIAKKKYDYSASVNINRDIDKDFNYFETPNSKRVFNQIKFDYQEGIRAFTIVGAYGTGKSSFLIELINRLSKNTDELNINNSIDKFEKISFVGHYGSFIDTIETFFNRIYQNEDSILENFELFHRDLNNQNKGLLIAIDEFGKHLEYAAKNNPEREIYFIQQLAEFVNDRNKNIILVTTLHQDFGSYAYSLSTNQLNEWTKVKGRFKELTFNEPVEQLLYLAAQRLTLNEVEYKPEYFEELFSLVKKSNSISLNNYLNEKIAKQLLPFDILSASILTLSLQKYGQNERSLFSFFESNDYLGLNDLNFENDNYYNLSNVYDYLLHNYNSFLINKYNPDYSKWAIIRDSIERCYSLKDVNYYQAIKIVKTIGLLNIFAQKSAIIDKGFLVKYALYSLKVKDSKGIIEKLEKNKIIFFRKHQNKYILFKGTDVDINLSVEKATNKIDGEIDLIKELNSYFDYPYIPAKAYQYKYGTPRFFEFKLSDKPLNKTPQNEVDGIINLIFSDKSSIEEVKSKSLSCDEAILFGVYKNSSDIKELVNEIKKIQIAKNENIEDSVARNEFDTLIKHYKSELNNQVIKNISLSNKKISWIFKGEIISSKNRKNFNHLLSQICEQIYFKSPVFRNEMVNKSNISGAISNARKNLISKLITDHEKANIGFQDDKFPPEKTIYLSLLKNNGFHEQVEGKYILKEPNGNSFNQLWEVCIDFLNDSKRNKRNLNDLINILSQKPFKLKKGFIDYWIPIFLVIKKNDYALYGDNGFIPEITTETLNLLVKQPKRYYLKAFDVDGIKLELFNKYRQLLEINNSKHINSESFIETIKPFFTFYNSLTTYSKNTKRLPEKSIALRQVIVHSTDPEKTFFHEFPKALNYSIGELQKDDSLAQEFIDDLRKCIKQIRLSYDKLLDRFEDFIIEQIVSSNENNQFPNYKTELQKRYDNLEKSLLINHQKVFLQRINSNLDDRKLWLNSVGQAVLGKPLDKINDVDEKKLYQNFRRLIIELDDMNDLNSLSNFDPKKEQALKLQITDHDEGYVQNTVRISKSKLEKSGSLEKKIRNQLNQDNQINIHILVKLLKEQLDDGKG